MDTEIKDIISFITPFMLSRDFVLNIKGKDQDQDQDQDQQQPDQDQQPEQNQQPDQDQQLEPPTTTIPIFTTSTLKNTNDPLFWCLYVLKYGMEEFSLIEPRRYTNIIIEEKNKLVEYLNANMVLARKFIKKHKITNVSLKEMMSEILSNQQTDFKNVWLFCFYYSLTLYFVNIEKKTYYVANPLIVEDETENKVNEDKDEKVEEKGNIHIIEYICKKRNIEKQQKPTVEGIKRYEYSLKIGNNINEIKTRLFKIVNVQKPLKTITNYKTTELEEIANQLEIPNIPLKIKKLELYKMIVDYLAV